MIFPHLLLSGEDMKDSESDSPAIHQLHGLHVLYGDDDRHRSCIVKNTIRVYLVSFLFFRSMSLRCPAKNQKVAHRWLQTMDQMRAKSHEEGEVSGTCTLCNQGITVRRSKKLNYSRRRMYESCADKEHDLFVWLEPPSHLPRQWEKCACADAMECREENHQPLFKCWQRNGCGDVQEVPHQHIVDHSECVLCKLTKPTTNSSIRL